MRRGDRSHPYTRRTFLRLTGAGLAGLPALAGPARGELARGGSELWVHEELYLTIGGSLDATIVGGTAYYMPIRGKLVAVDVLESNRAGEAVVDWSLAFTDEYDISSFSAPVSTPSVVDETVYVEGEAGVFAVNAEDGTPKWFTELDGSNLSSAPTATDERVYVTTEMAVYALSTEDGSVLWEQSFPESENLGRNQKSAPTVADGKVFVGTEVRLVALNAADGSEEWAVEGAVGEADDEPFRPAPTVADGVVYARSLAKPFQGEPTEVVYALDAANGAERWRHERPVPQAGLARSSPTVADGRLVVGTVDDDDVVAYALDVETGDEVWTFSGADEDGGSASSPTVADGTVFVGGLERMYAVDLADGSEEWSWTDEGESRDRIRSGKVGSSPTVVDGAVFFVYAGALFALYGGVQSSSEDSRVELGTLGHHHAWAGEPPQKLLTAVTGTVTGPDGDPVEGADVYLAPSRQAHVGLGILEEFPDAPDPGGELDLAGEPTTTDANGRYALTAVDPGQYFVLVVPPEDSDAVPTLVSDLALAPGDEETADVQLSTHPLAPLDPAITQLNVQSTGAMDAATTDAARTLTESADDFAAAALGELLGKLEQPAEFDDEAAQDLVDSGFDLAVGSIKKALTALQEETPEGFEAVVEELGESDLLEEESLENPDTDELIQDVYRSLPIYVDAADRVTSATEGTYEDLAGEYRPGDPALETFSVPAATDALRGVVRQLSDPRRGVPGFVVTPTGDLYQVDQADTYRTEADVTRQRRSTVGDLKTAAQVTQVVGGVLMVTGVGSSAGGTLYAVGQGSQRALEVADLVLLTKLAVVTLLAQIGWGFDVAQAGSVPPAVVDWLDRRLEEGLAAADLEISDRDLNLEVPLDDRLPKYVVANRPENVDANPLIDINWAAVETAEVEVKNAGETVADYRVTAYDFFGGGDLISRRGVASEVDTGDLAPGESTTVAVEYAATFGGISDLLEDHTLVIQVWNDGVIRAQEVEHFHVRVNADVTPPLPGLAGAPGRDWSRRVTPSPARIEAARSSSTTLLEDSVAPDDPVVETTHTVGDDVREVEYTLSTPGDVALLVTDGEGEAVGYEPGRDTIRTDLPDGEYVGPTATPQTATFTVDPGAEYTVRAIGYGFRRDQSVPVTVRVWERPEREAMVGLSPPRPQVFVSPGRTAELSLSVAEFGGQVAAEDVRLRTASFPEGVSADPEDPELSVAAGAEQETTVAVTADEGFSPGDPPADTRFDGDVVVETADGTATAPVDGLALATETDADLTNADRSVEGVALSTVDPETLEDVPDLDGEVAAAYELTVSGSGAVELSLPVSGEDVFGAVYAAGDEWPSLPVGWIDGRTQVRVDTETVESTADDRWGRILVLSERPLSGGDDGSGDDGGSDGGSGDDGGSDGGDGGDGSDGGDGGSGGGGGSADVFGPAVGVGGLLAAGAGAGYLLKRRLGGEGGAGG